MDQSYEKILQAVGFSDRESELYLAGLKLGTAPASAYAKATNLNRVTAYNELEVMSQRGIFIVSEQAASKCYTPISIDAVAETFEKNVSDFKTALPILRSLQSDTIAQPSVRLLEGLDSIEAVMMELLNEVKEVHAIFHDQNDITWGTMLSNWHKQRIERGISACVLSDNSSHYGRAEDQLLEVRKMSSELEAEMLVSEEHLLMFYRPENGSPYAIFIHQPAVISLQQQLFEQAWHQAEVVESSSPAPIETPVAETITEVTPTPTPVVPQVSTPVSIEHEDEEGGQKIKISVTP